MGKSYKKELVKKINGSVKKDYWSRVRSVTKNVIRSKDIEDLDDSIPDPKSIINDYNYIDGTWRDEDNNKMYRK